MYKQKLSPQKKIYRELKKGWDHLHSFILYKLKTRGKSWSCLNPLLIVGCGHTGTTWLLRILAAHPDLYAIPFETSYARRREKSRSRKLIKRFDQKTVCLGKARWLEKTPKHVRHLKDIFNFHNEAQVIVMIRDPRDVVASLKKRMGNFEEAFQRWMADNQEAEKWRNDKRVMFVKYEDLKSDLKATLTEITRFAGLEWKASLMDYNKYNFQFLPELEHASQSDDQHIQHLKNRQWQIEQKEYDGRGRWKKELNDSELETIQTRGSELISLQGYDIS